MSDFFKWIDGDAPTWVTLVFVATCMFAALAAFIYWAALVAATGSLKLFLAPFVIAIIVVLTAYFRRGDRHE